MTTTDTENWLYGFQNDGWFCFQKTETKATLFQFSAHLCWMPNAGCQSNVVNKIYHDTTGLFQLVFILVYILKEALEAGKPFTQ